MQVRDVLIENQSIEIDELKDTIIKSDEIIKNLNIRNEQLIKEITEARKELSSYEVIEKGVLKHIKRRIKI